MYVQEVFVYTIVFVLGLYSVYFIYFKEKKKKNHETEPQNRIRRLLK